MGVNVFVVGLRRSGTTIFWRMFREDERLLCLDEPFNPSLRDLPEPHPKQTRDEFITLHERDPSRLEQRLAPIPLEEELTPELTTDQLNYLQWLLTLGDTLVCDFTRCMFKVDDLHAADPSAVLVHLHRRPESVATSHLLPSGAETWRQRFGSVARRLSFWWRKRWYDNWGFETIIGESSESDFGDLLARRGVDSDRVYRLPAVGRLMAYWTIAYTAIERDGSKLFGERFVSIPFESFCAEPDATIESIYHEAGLQEMTDNHPVVQDPKGPYRPHHHMWRRIIRELEAAGLKVPNREE